MATWRTSCIWFLWIFLAFETMSSSSVSNDDWSDDGDEWQFTFEIPGRRQECYYQDVRTGGSIYVMYEVVTQTEVGIELTIRDAEGKQVLASPDPETLYPKRSEEEIIVTKRSGVHRICFSNRHSVWQKKVIALLYIVTNANKKWEDNEKEDRAKIEEGTKNISVSLYKVEDHLRKITRNRMKGRVYEITDYNRAKKINEAVTNWSLALSLATLGTAVMQVYFIRKLFATQNVTTSNKTPA
ncbi:transmembrane emp24 domain-containing protein 7-like [Lineus longissimus]|uniref:transmembrane emp24 domain-containing protein 7-like n=1 Tax=Lineus longissimus TaxID=88925 RepID=UPI00315C8103